jgi:hypothetical protein
MRWKSVEGVVGMAVMLAVGGPRLEAQKPKTVDPLCQRVLPAEVANRLTGHNDLQLIPRLSITAAGGTCNYAADGKKMVFLVTVLGEGRKAAEQYARYKGQASYLPHQTDVAALGDAAFTGGDYEHMLVARKGERVILMASMLEMEKPSRQLHARVPRDQLIAIAREVIGKL